MLFSCGLEELALMTPVSPLGWTIGRHAQIRVAQQDDLRTGLRRRFGCGPPSPRKSERHNSCLMPSRAPRSICTLRHQLAGSRAMTRASLTFHGVCRGQPTSAAQAGVFASRWPRPAASWIFSSWFCRRSSSFWRSKLRLWNDQSPCGLAGQLVHGAGQAEQGQKKPADGQLDLAHGFAGQFQQHHHQQNHQNQNYIMRLFQHLAPAASLSGAAAS